MKIKKILIFSGIIIVLVIMIGKNFYGNKKLQGQLTIPQKNTTLPANTTTPSVQLVNRTINLGAQESDVLKISPLSESEMQQLMNSVEKISTTHFTIYYELQENNMSYDEPMPTEETVTNLGNQLEQIWSYYYLKSMPDGSPALSFRKPPDDNVTIFFNILPFADKKGLGGAVFEFANQVYIFLNSTDLNVLSHEMFHVTQTAYPKILKDSTSSADTKLLEGTATFAQTLYNTEYTITSFGSRMNAYFFTNNYLSFVGQEYGISNLEYTSGPFWRYISEKFTTDPADKNLETWYSAEFIKTYFERIEEGVKTASTKEHLKILDKLIQERSDGKSSLAKAFRDFAITNAIFTFKNIPQQYSYAIYNRPRQTSSWDTPGFQESVPGNYHYEFFTGKSDNLKIFPEYALDAYGFQKNVPHAGNLVISFHPQNVDTELIIIMLKFDGTHDYDTRKLLADPIILKGTQENYKIDLSKYSTELNYIYFRTVSYDQPGGKYTLDYSFQ